MHDHADPAPDSTEATRDLPADSRPPPPAPPFMVGRYEVRRIIAEHGQGLLCEAFDPQLERTVAVKIVVSRGQDDHGPERCEREARALARLKHPNIVAVFDGGETIISARPARYFVMEYLHGARPLPEYAEAHGLQVHERIRLVIPLCDAIAAGHAAGILHRDLKPSNLLVDRQGVPRVIDFGLASGRVVDAADALRGQERGSILGTIWYMSPQHFEGDPDLIDERADVYAMGVVLQELLTGELPYDVRGRSLIEAAEIIKHKAAAPLRGAGRPVRGDLAAVVRRALEKDPLRRYQSMRELADELRRWLAAEPVHARPAGAVERVASSLRRTAFNAPRASLVACGGLAVIIAATIGMTPLDPWIGQAGIDARAVLGVSRSGLQVARAVVIDDGTDLAGLAASLDLPGVDPQNPLTFRPLYGRMLSRLARACPKVVAIDIALSDRDDPGDAELVAGIDALVAAGCRVVVASPLWPTRVTDDPPLDRDVLPRVTWGGVTGTFSDEKPWLSALAVAQPGQGLACPSLALAVYCGWLRPEADFTAAISIEPPAVRLRFWERGKSMHAADEQALPASFVGFNRGAPRYGVAPGALIAHCLLEVPPVKVFDRATYDAGELISMTPEQLNARFQGLVVIIARSITGWDDEDKIKHPDGSDLPGYKAQMAAVDTLTNDRSVRYASDAQHIGAIIAAAAIGLAFGVVTFSRFPARWGLLIGAGAGIMALSLAGVSWAGLFVTPGAVILAMMMAAEFGAAVTRIRRVRGVGLLDRPEGVGVGL